MKNNTKQIVIAGLSASTLVLCVFTFFALCAGNVVDSKGKSIAMEYIAQGVSYVPAAFILGMVIAVVLKAVKS